ncbi:MAG: hypothetical protein KJ623_00880 [Nanoarchaeota archaeon]|nr:hypothetical protein [Nanoarchaeota archaeon]
MNLNEFKIKYSDLIVKKADDKTWQDFLIKYYSRVIEDGTWGLIQSINKNNFQDFSKNIIELNEIHDKTKTERLTIEELHTLKSKLLNIESEIIIKINAYKMNIKMQSKEKWKERGFGCIIGITASLIAGIILFYLIN